MFAAAGEKRRAIELTNTLLARGAVVETNVIAARLVLVGEAIFPAVYALRTRNRSSALSSNAARAFELICQEGHATSGEVRRYLGVAGSARPDPGDRALAEERVDHSLGLGPEYTCAEEFRLAPAAFLELLACMEPVAFAGLFRGWKEREPKHSILGIYQRC